MAVNEPSKRNAPEQDINFEGTSGAGVGVDTVKGGSALPGSAVEPTEGGYQDVIQDKGFLGTREFPDQDDQ